MRLRLIVPLLALVATAACLETLAPPNGRLGLITVETFGPDDPNYVVAPNAFFLGGTTNQFSVFPSDSCVVSVYQPPAISGYSRMLLAGDAIGVSVSGQAGSLLPETDGFVITYSAVTPTGISFTPGDTMTVTVPGETDGFPAASIKVRTSEPFTHSVVPEVPEQGVAIDLTWDAAPAPGSVISFSLRYASNGANVVNQQVLCVYTDDGAGTIPGYLLNGWRTTDRRQLVVTRLRHTTVDVDDRSTLAIVSTFTRPLGSYSPTP